MYDVWPNVTSFRLGIAQPFPHQTWPNLGVVLLILRGKLAAILGSRQPVFGQDSLPFFGRETPTAFRQHDRIEDSLPKNGSRFATEKR